MVLLPVLLAWAGCAGTAEKPGARAETPPKPAALRIHLASDQQRPGFREMSGPNGQKVYVSPVVELNNADVADVRALHSGKRSMLQIVLNTIAANQFYDLTRRNIGAQMAVFIDDELICTLPITSPVVGGQIHVIGVFSREKAESVVAALNRR